MRLIIISLIIILNLILKSTVFQWLEIYGVIPNTTLAIVISFSIHLGKNKGAILGFFAGILHDIILGRIIGLNAVIFMIIGYIVGLMNQKIFKDNLLIPVILTAFGTIFYETLHLFLIFLFGYKVKLFDIIQKILIVEVLYNSIISPFVYFYVSKLLKSKAMKKGH